MIRSALFAAWSVCLIASVVTAEDATARAAQPVRPLRYHPEGDDIVIANDIHHVCGREDDLMFVHFHIRVDLLCRFFCRVNLKTAHVSCSMDYLPVEIREIYPVEIDYSKSPYACCGKVGDCGRCKPAGSDYENFCVEKLELTVLSDLLEGELLIGVEAEALAQDVGLDGLELLEERADLARHRVVDEAL